MLEYESIRLRGRRHRCCRRHSVAVAKKRKGESFPARLSAYFCNCCCRRRLPQLDRSFHRTFVRMTPVVELVRVPISFTDYRVKILF